MSPLRKPVVLCFSGHDPSGGAGVQADIETLVSHQCHACTVITALTEQDTRNVKNLIPQRVDDFISQTKMLLVDFTVKAIKIGLIGDIEICKAIQQVLVENPQIPVILDPVLAAGGGKALSDDNLSNAIFDRLLPHTTVLTPNSEEARILARLTNLDECGLSLLDQGCQYVFITGTHENTQKVTNRLYHQNKLVESFNWDRLPASYHGSGCTLAASIAASIAHDLDPFHAVLEAQEYTWNALNEAYCPDQGQHIPNRLFWMQEQ
jgi:hydroxymethylpyrimidine/phosphomethylpyrimidine kinase